MSAAAFNLYKLKNTCCVVVGLGLIGQSITDYLGLYGERLKSGTQSFSWDSSDDIEKSINNLIQSSGRERFELIWSGGMPGFLLRMMKWKKNTKFFQSSLKILQ